MRAGSYLDTSFLIKLYVAELDSQAVVSWFRSYAGDVLIGSLTDVEMAAALYRRLLAKEAFLAHQAYLEDCAIEVYRKVKIDADVFTEASTIAVQCAANFSLRSLDAIHLATALTSGVAEFATFDKRLAEAASHFGLRILPARS